MEFTFDFMNCRTITKVAHDRTAYGSTVAIYIRTFLFVFHGAPELMAHIQTSKHRSLDTTDPSRTGEVCPVVVVFQC